MIIYYSANGVSGQMGLPSSFVEDCRAEDLAEMVTNYFWHQRPCEEPLLVTRTHLMDVDGKDLGMFEVRREMRPIFTAIALSGQG